MNEHERNPEAMAAAEDVVLRALAAFYEGVDRHDHVPIELKWAYEPELRRRAARRPRPQVVSDPMKPWKVADLLAVARRVMGDIDVQLKASTATCEQLDGMWYRATLIDVPLGFVCEWAQQQECYLSIDALNSAVDRLVVKGRACWVDPQEGLEGVWRIGERALVVIAGRCRNRDFADRVSRGRAIRITERGLAEAAVAHVASAEPPLHLMQRLSDTAGKMLEAFWKAPGRPLSSGDARLNFCSSKTRTKYLRELVDAGILEKVGSHGGWRLRFPLVSR